MLVFVQMPDFGKRGFLGPDRWEAVKDKNHQGSRGIRARLKPELSRKQERKMYVLTAGGGEVEVTSGQFCLWSQVIRFIRSTHVIKHFLLYSFSNYNIFTPKQWFFDYLISFYIPSTVLPLHPSSQGVWAPMGSQQKVWHFKLGHPTIGNGLQ